MLARLAFLSAPLVLIHALTRISLSHYWSIFPLMLFCLMLSGAESVRSFLTYKRYGYLFVSIVSFDSVFMMMNSWIINKHMTPELIRAVNHHFFWF